MNYSKTKLLSIFCCYYVADFRLKDNNLPSFLRKLSSCEIIMRCKKKNILSLKLCKYISVICTKFYNKNTFSPIMNSDYAKFNPSFSFKIQLVPKSINLKWFIKS